MKLNLFLLLATFTTPAVVRATYSIAATDRANQLVGGAGASCVQDDDIGAILYHGVPGKGVLHTQAVALDADSAAVTTGLEQIEQGLDPATILQNMNDLDAETDKGSLFGLGDDIPNSELRQNAIANLHGQHAGHTGTAIDPLYINVLGIIGSNQSDDGAIMGDFTYTAQGNVVTNETVATLLAGFGGEGCDLPEKLMNALEAVSKSGAGDERCLLAEYEPTGVSGVPSAGGFIKVQAPNGDYIIDINVIGDGSVGPTIEL